MANHYAITIIDRIADILEAANTAAGRSISKFRIYGLEAGDLPHICVMIGADAFFDTGDSGVRYDSELTVEFVIYCDGLDAIVAATNIRAEIQAALLAGGDVTLGIAGVFEIFPTATDAPIPDEESQNNLIELATRYSIRYRTDLTDPTQPIG